MMPNNLRKTTIAGAILVIIGLILIICFLSSLGSQGASDYEEQPLFGLHNCDGNLSHSVYVSVIYSNGTEYKTAYTLLPGQFIYSTVNNTVRSNQDLDFNFTIDTKPPMHLREPVAPRATIYFDICDSQGNNSVSDTVFIGDYL